MKQLLAIAMCKALYFIGKLMGKGSSLPGRVALKVCPDILSRLKLPKTIIAVTGSNGKTTTAELIAQALKTCGVSVGWNHEGANQIEGITTLLLRITTLGGTVKRDALVLECDERYTRITFKYINPSILVVTNLCRDQLTRNGHHEFIQDSIRAAMEVCQDNGSPDTLILNADDPYTSALAYTAKTEIGEGEASRESVAVRLQSNRVVWFGVGPNAVASDNKKEFHANSEFRIADFESAIQPRYDDGAFCPVCKGRMTYAYRVAGHFGKYCCNSCGFTRAGPEIEISGFDIKSGEVAIIANSEYLTQNSKDSNITAHLAFPSLTGAYNMIAAIATAAVAGIKAEDAARALDGYELKGGRTIRFLVSNRNDGILLVSKHENSMSYNQSLAWAVGRQIPCTIIVLVDSISRKYFTSETSWLWDIDFDILADDCVKNIVLTGRYINELAARFALTAINPGKIGYITDISGLREYIERSTEGDIYAVTCFSDKDKLIKTFQ